jgi:hypothetical protein
MCRRCAISRFSTVFAGWRSCWCCSFTSPASAADPRLASGSVVERAFARLIDTSGCGVDLFFVLSPAAPWATAGTRAGWHLHEKQFLKLKSRFA